MSPQEIERLGMDIFIGGVDKACSGRREWLTAHLLVEHLAAFPDMGLPDRVVLEVMRGPALKAAFVRRELARN